MTDRAWRVEINVETLFVVIAFVLFFVIADMLSTVLVIRQYGSAIVVSEINLFVHLSGVNGLASMKLGILIFAICALFVFWRYQVVIDDVLIGLAVAGVVCAASNLCLAAYGYVPSIGPVNAIYASGLAISISVMRSMIDARRLHKYNNMLK